MISHKKNLFSETQGYSDYWIYEWFIDSKLSLTNVIIMKFISDLLLIYIIDILVTAIKKKLL